MKIKIIPKRGFIEFKELEKNLDEFAPAINSEFKKMHRFERTNLVWERNGNAYDIYIDYSNEGKIRNIVFKRMFKNAIKRAKLDVDIR